jgi:hypothetical protein
VLAFDVGTELLPRIALAIGIAGLALALLTLGGILAARARDIALGRRRAAFNAVWRPILAAAALDDAPAGSNEIRPEMPLLQPRDYRFFLEEWNVFQDLLRGDSRSGLNRLARQLGIDSLAWRLLEHRRQAERLLAIATLGHLGESAAWQPAVALLNVKHTLVSLVSARALIGIDARAAINEVLPVIRDRDDWATTRVAALFKDAGADVASGPLEEAILSSEPDEVPKLIAVLPEIPLAAAGRIVSELLRRPSDDRIKGICLRVLESPEELPRVRQLTSHPRWHLRMGAAAVLGRLGQPEDRAHLVRLLADPEWWVRYRSAQALLAMPFVGREGVRALRDSVEDAFAHDILEQVLAESGA